MPPPSEASLPVAPGDLLADRYRVERVLGVGGMGVVVAARHGDLGHLVAIKVLLPALAGRPDVVERFLREARAAVQLRSEHTVRVTDVGVHQQPRANGPTPPRPLPFMVMEYLDGASLWDLLQRGPMPVADAAEHVAQACEALDEAHRLGIIHRDLKPDNLFVTRRPNGAPFVKVLDFGISSVPQGEGASRLTGAAEVMGTPLYMAPEQMTSARNADARSDVWALGATLYELLAGRPAFDGASVAEICTRVLTGTPASLRAARPDVPPDLEGIVMRCLEKASERRFATAADLAQALAPFRHAGSAWAPRQPSMPDAAAAYPPAPAPQRPIPPPPAAAPHAGAMSPGGQSLNVPFPGAPPPGLSPSGETGASSPGVTPPGLSPAPAVTPLGHAMAFASTEVAVAGGSGTGRLRWGLISFAAGLAVLAGVATVVVLSHGDGAGASPSAAADSASANIGSANIGSANTVSANTASANTASAGAIAVVPAASGEPAASDPTTPPAPASAPSTKPASPPASTGPVSGTTTRPPGTAAATATASVRRPPSPFKDHR